MTTDQVTFTEAELLRTHDVAEPLIAGGVRCHGGFDDDGTYVSPRTLHRVPAIEAWQAQHVATFGTEVLHVPLDTWPEHFPNVAQARHLIDERRPRAAHRHADPHRHRRGLRRQHPLPRSRATCRRTSTRTSAARPSTTSARGSSRPTGATKRAGRRRPATRTCGSRPGTSPSRTPRPRSTSTPCSSAWASVRPARPAANLLDRLLPDDIDVNLELIANLMIRVLLIEVQAFHTFAWADAWLSDPDLVAGDGKAADLVSYIRADETPHVGYLKTALTEMRDRTWIGTTGKKHVGADMIGQLWERSLDNSPRCGPGPHPRRRAQRGRALVPAAPQRQGRPRPLLRAGRGLEVPRFCAHPAPHGGAGCAQKHRKTRATPAPDQPKPIGGRGHQTAEGST